MSQDTLTSQLHGVCHEVEAGNACGKGPFNEVRRCLVSDAMEMPLDSLSCGLSNSPAGLYNRTNHDNRAEVMQR